MCFLRISKRSRLASTPRQYPILPTNCDFSCFLFSSLLMFFKGEGGVKAGATLLMTGAMGMVAVEDGARVKGRWIGAWRPGRGAGFDRVGEGLGCLGVSKVGGVVSVARDLVVRFRKLRV